MNGKIIGAVNSTAMSPTTAKEEEAKCLNSSTSELAKCKKNGKLLAETKLITNKPSQLATSQSERRKRRVLMTS